MLLVRCARNWHDTHVGNEAESPSPTGKGEAGVNRPAMWYSIPDTPRAMPLIRQWGGNGFSVHILREQRSPIHAPSTMQPRTRAVQQRDAPIQMLAQQPFRRNFAL